MLPDLQQKLKQVQRSINVNFLEITNLNVNVSRDLSV